MLKDFKNNDEIALKILTSEEIKKSNSQLNQFKNNGSIIEITELAILTGALWREVKSPVYGQIPVGNIITRTNNEIGKIKYIDSDGKEVTVGGRACKSRNFTIVPVIMPSQELWDKLIKNKITINSYNYELHQSFEEDIVYFGEYPQTIPNAVTRKALTEDFNNNVLNETGRIYIFDETDSNSIHKPFKPVIYHEYEKNGKKYIRLKAKLCNLYNYYTKKNICIKSGDYVWVEVKPVEWVIDYKNYSLVSRRGLLSGIRYNKRYIEPYSEQSFIDTELYKYQNTYMLNNLFQDISLKEEIQTTNTQIEENEEQNKINNLLNEIKKYITYYHGNEDINKIIDNLLNEYNNSLELINKTRRNKTINLEVLSTEVLYNNLIIKLELILDKLKRNYEDNQKYIEMINLIISLRHILDNTITLDLENELYDDFKLISERILPFLDEIQKNEIKNDLITILDNYSKEIIDYLDSIQILNNNCSPKEIKYHNIKELELSIRKDIHNILIKLSFYVKRKDIIKELLENISNSIQGIYKKSQDRIESIIINEISAIIKRINNKVNANKEYYNYYIDEMNKLTNIKLDYENNNSEIYKIIMDIYTKLSKLELDLDSEIKVNSYKVRTKEILK